MLVFFLIYTLMKYLMKFNEKLNDLSEIKAAIEDIFVELLDEEYSIRYEKSKYIKVIITKPKYGDILNEKVIDTLVKFFEVADGKYNFVNSWGAKNVVFHYNNKKKFEPEYCTVNIDDFINGELPKIGIEHCRLILFNIF